MQTISLAWVSETVVQIRNVYSHVMGFAKRISDIMICSMTKHHSNNVAFASTVGNVTCYSLHPGSVTTVTGIILSPHIENTPLQCCW